MYFKLNIFQVDLHIFSKTFIIIKKSCSLFYTCFRKLTECFHIKLLERIKLENSFQHMLFSKNVFTIIYLIICIFMLLLFGDVHFKIISSSPKNTLSDFSLRTQINILKLICNIFFSSNNNIKLPFLRFFVSPVF